MSAENSADQLMHFEASINAELCEVERKMKAVMLESKAVQDEVEILAREREKLGHILIEERAQRVDLVESRKGAEAAASVVQGLLDNIRAMVERQEKALGICNGFSEKTEAMTNEAKAMLETCAGELLQAEQGLDKLKLECEEQKSAMGDQRQRLTKDLDFLKNKLEVVQKEKLEILKESQTADEKISELEQVKSQHDKLMDKCRVCQEEGDNVQQKIDQGTRNVENLKKVFEQQDVTIQTLKETREQTREKETSLAAQITVLQEDTLLCEGSISTWADHVEQVGGANYALKREIKSLLQYPGQVEKAKKELDDLQKANEKADRQLQKSIKVQKQNVELTQQVTALKQEMGVIEKKFSHASELVAKTAAANNDDDTFSNGDNINKEVYRVQSENDHLNTKVEQLKNELNQKQQKKKEMKETMAKLQIDVDSSETLANLEADMNQKCMEMVQKLRSMQETIVANDKLIQSKDLEYEQLRKDRIKANDELCQKQKDEYNQTKMLVDETAKKRQESLDLSKMLEAKIQQLEAQAKKKMDISTPASGTSSVQSSSRRVKAETRNVKPNDRVKKVQENPIMEAPFVRPKNVKTTKDLVRKRRILIPMDEIDNSNNDDIGKESGNCKKTNKFFKSKK